MFTICWMVCHCVGLFADRPFGIWRRNLPASGGDAYARFLPCHSERSEESDWTQYLKLLEGGTYTQIPRYARDDTTGSSRRTLRQRLANTEELRCFLHPMPYIRIATSVRRSIEPLLSPLHILVQPGRYAGPQVKPRFFRYLPMVLVGVHIHRDRLAKRF